MRVAKKSVNWRLMLASVMVPGFLTACGSVGLDRGYEAPPIRVPGEKTTQVPPVPTPAPTAQTAPVRTAPIHRADETTVAPSTAQQTMRPRITLTSNLSGAHAVPSVLGAADGRVDALYDSRTQLLRWKATWGGLSGPIMSVQFHGPADAGQLADATVIWPGPFDSRYEGRASLTPKQASELVNGQWYVNVTTGLYPEGELRGQMRVAN